MIEIIKNKKENKMALVQKIKISSLFSSICKKSSDIEDFDYRDDTPEGDRILGEAAAKIRKECALISEEEFYRVVGM